MSISTADIRAVFTKTLVDVYQERPKVSNFLQSFFPVETVPTKTFAIEVERMGEKIAVDVVRGTEGNRNTFSKSTEKIFEPPLFREYFDLTELDLYDRVLGSQGNAQIPLFKALLNSGADRLGMLIDKIKRTRELQCASILEFGTVTMNYGATAQINYNRKVASFSDIAGDYFTTTSDPFVTFTKACDFLRKIGRSGDGTYNAILGSDALAALLVNAKFLVRQNLFNMALDAVVAPSGARDAAGNTFHGTITCGSYKVQLWAYPQFYDLNTGTDAAPVYVSTPYWNPKKVVVIPAKPRFKTICTAVPMLIGQPGQMPQQGEFVMQEFLDERRAKHILDVQNAPLPIPIAVDTMYTFVAST